jgi:hypothetical protein
MVVAQQLNQILGEAVAQIGEVLGMVDPDTVEDSRAAQVLNRINRVIRKLEQEVEEFTRQMK